MTSSQVRIEDWISSDMDPSKSKGTPAPPQPTQSSISLSQYVWMYSSSILVICSSGTESVDTAGSEIMLQFNNSPEGGRRSPDFQYKLHKALQSNQGQSYSYLFPHSLWLFEYIFLYIICTSMLKQNRTTYVLHSIRVGGKWLSKNIWSDQLHFKRSSWQPCQAETTG